MARAGVNVEAPDLTPPLKSFKKGGKVKKTGVYKLHKGEKVVPAKKAKMKSNSSDSVFYKSAGMKNN